MPHSVLGRLLARGLGFGFFSPAEQTTRGWGGMGEKGWSGTAAVQSSVSIRTSMTGPEPQGQQKRVNNAAMLTDSPSCSFVSLIRHSGTVAAEGQRPIKKQLNRKMPAGWGGGEINPNAAKHLQFQ